MNKLIKRCFLMFLFTVIFVLPAFSDSWYLCLGSFKLEKNALSLVKSLEAEGLDATIENFEKNSELYYRVLLADGYESRDKARSKIPEVEALPIIKKLKISGIWICVGPDKAETAKKQQLPQDITKELVLESKSVSTAVQTPKTVETKTEPAVTEKTVQPTVQPVEAKNEAKAEPKTATTKTEEAVKSEEPAKVEAPITESKEPAAVKNPTEEKTVEPVKTTEKAASTTSKKTSSTKTTTESKKTTTTKKPAVSEKTVAKAAEKTVEKPAEKPVVPVEKPVVEEKKSEVKTEVKTAPVIEELDPIPEPEVKTDMVSIARELERQLAAAREAEALSAAKPEVKETVAETPVVETVPEIKNETTEAPVEEVKSEEESAEPKAEEATVTEEPAESATEEASAPDTTETKIEAPAAEIETPSVPLPEIILAIDAAAKKPFTVNYVEDILISEELPYSIYINSHKDEESALRDKKRLESYSVSSYLVKTFTEERGILFDLYSGAYETQEEAEDYQRALKLLGVIGTKVVNYSVLSDQMKKYNDFIATNTIIPYDCSAAKIPDSISDQVLKAIKVFPMGKDYHIEELVVYDVKNVIKAKLDNDYIDELDSYIYQKDKVDGAVYGIIEDHLFGHQLSVYVQSGTDFDVEGISTEVTRRIMIGDNSYNGYISSKDGYYYYTALNEDHSVMVKIIGNNVTEPIFNIVLTTMFDEGVLLDNPYFDKAIYTLAKKAENREFEYFVVETIDEEAAYTEGFVKDTKLLAGHTWAWSYFMQDDVLIETVALDPDYDYIANTFYDYYQNMRFRGTISDINRPSFVPFVDSWYFENEDQDTVELAVKIRPCFLITGASESTLGERDLVNFVEDMLILSH